MKSDSSRRSSLLREQNAFNEHQKLFYTGETTDSHSEQKEPGPFTVRPSKIGFSDQSGFNCAAFNFSHFKNDDRSGKGMEAFGINVPEEWSGGLVGNCLENQTSPNLEKEMENELFSSLPRNDPQNSEVPEETTRMQPSASLQMQNALALENPIPHDFNSRSRIDQAADPNSSFQILKSLLQKKSPPAKIDSTDALKPFQLLSLKRAPSLKQYSSSSSSSKILRGCISVEF